MIRITFVGDFIYNYGSAQTILEYSKISKASKISISISGYVDKIIANKIPVIKKVNKKNTDITVFILENVMYLDPNKYPERISWYLDNIDRRKRIVIDTDAKYKTQIENINEPSEHDQKMWNFVIDELSDIILQPTIEPKSKDTLSFLFFGFPDIAKELPNKKFDVAYVGNNWFREDEISNFLQASLESNLVNKIKIRGRNWNKYKLLSRLPENSNSKQSTLNIEVGRSVLPDKLLKIMSTGTINPILVNNILLQRNLVTPRMFETFAADTIPLFYSDFSYCEQIYSDMGNNFSASLIEMKDKIKDVIQNLKKYINYRNSVRSYLISNHTHKKRLNDLRKIILSL